MDRDGWMDDPSGWKTIDDLNELFTSILSLARWALDTTSIIMSGQ